MFASLVASSLAVSAAPPGIAHLEDLAATGQVVGGFVAGGSGCAMLTAPIIVGDSITLILTDYIAEKDGRGLDRATCDVAVEVDLPPGLTVSVDSVTYRGFADGFNARSTFYREYFFAEQFTGDRRFTVVQYDSSGDPTILRDDSSEYVSDYGEFTARDEVTAVGYSNCGELATYRTNTALSVRNLFADSVSLSSIDTVDVHNAYYITYTLHLAPCDS
jgi:hypothetical protein